MLKSFKNIFSSSKDVSVNNNNIDEFDIFLEIVKSYMRANHPKIKISYDTFLFQNEPNIKVRKSLIIDHVIKQFSNYEYTKTTQKSVPKDMLWKGYNLNSSSNPKYPSDFLKRKELCWIRDEKLCDRCGKTLKELKDVNTIFAQDIKDGGTYHLENIIIVCFDCYKILNFQNDSKSSLYLTLNDELLDFIKD